MPVGKMNNKDPKAYSATCAAERFEGRENQACEKQINNANFDMPVGIAGKNRVMDCVWSNCLDRQPAVKCL